MAMAARRSPKRKETGGFHLATPAFEPIIWPTVEALAEVGPQVVAPTHCTGWRATHALAAGLS